MQKAEKKKQRKVYDDRGEMVAARKQYEVFSSYLSRRNEMGHERREILRKFSATSEKPNQRQKFGRYKMEISNFSEK